MNEFQAKLILWLQHHWLTIVLVIISLAAAALLGWLLWRRYSTSLFAWWRELRRTPEIRHDALIEIWSEFWYQIPQSLRRRVRRYPVCLVLGDHHSGKSTLIRSQGLKDIEGVRFDSGLQDNPLMQVYLTNEEIIVELSARFLYASTPDHTEALLAFCRKLPFDTRAVLVIDAHALMVSLEESQAALIDTLVGKLAQIGKVNDRAMPFALALTHMDRVPGFREFSDFTAAVGLPIRVTLKAQSPVADVTEGLSDYFDYLNNILVSPLAGQFIPIFGFLANSKGLLAKLSGFLRVSCNKSELPPLTLERVCLHSNNAGSQIWSGIDNNPFWREPVTHPWKGVIGSRHFKRASILGGLLITLQCISYWDERHAIEQAVSLIKQIPQIRKDLYFKQVHPTLDALGLRMADTFDEAANPSHQNPLRYFLYDYFRNYRSKIKPAIADALRTTYLLPRLDEVKQEPHTYVKLIRLMALLHANEHNILRTYFTDDDSTEGTGIPTEIINDYILFNENINAPQLIKLETTDYVDYETNFGDEASTLGDQNSLWTQLVFDYSFASQRDYLTSQGLERLRSNARNLLAVINRMVNTQYLDEQRKWLEENGHVSARTKAEWEKYPAGAQVSSPALIEALKMIASTDISPSSIPTSMTDCFNRIMAIEEIYAKRVADTNLGIVSANVGSSRLIFDSQQWITLAQRSAAKELLESFYQSQVNKEGWAFFDTSNPSYTIRLGASTDASGSLVNNAQIDVRLTRDGFEKKVIPAVELLSNILPKLSLLQPEKQALVDFFVRSLSMYGQNYASSYWNFLRSLNLRILSREQLIMYLREIQRPGSAFTQNLVRIKDNVILNIPEGPNYQPFRERLDDFRFLQSLMQEEKGTYPQLQRYMAIIADLSDKLASSTQPKMLSVSGEKSEAAVNGMRSLLSPMGRVAYDLKTAGEGNSLIMVQSWLREMMVPDQWKPLFLAPIFKLEEYGQSEINSAVTSLWKKVWSQRVEPLLGLFPFDLNTGRPEATPGMIAEVFHPLTGTFWRDFHSYFSGILDATEGHWAVRQDFRDFVALSAKPQYQMDAVQRLTNTLWNKEGKAEPMNLQVKSGLLPDLPNREESPEAPSAELIYLRSGSASVIGFNQRSDWQDLSDEWWNKGNATAGIQFQRGSETIKLYASEDIDGKNWALLHLINLATKERNAQRFSWSVRLPQDPETKYLCVFAFKNDPFEIFKAIMTGPTH